MAPSDLQNFLANFHNSNTCDDQTLAKIIDIIYIEDLKAFRDVTGQSKLQIHDISAFKGGRTKQRSKSPMIRNKSCL